MIKHGVAPFLECSSKGDKRFSAFYARVYNNRTIENLYQGFKIFKRPDGTLETGLSWQKAKGKHPVNSKEAHEYYSYLWDKYIENNPELLPILKAASGLSDIFGQSGHCCQATELWRIRNTK